MVDKGNGARVLLKGFGLSGFRSFAGDLQLVGPLGPVNVVAGRNNAGKSNLLRFIQSTLIKGGLHFNLDNVDYADRNSALPVKLRLASDPGVSIVQQFERLADASGRRYDSALARSGWQRLTELPQLNLGGGYVWFPYQMAGPDGQRSWDFDPAVITEIANGWPNDLSDLMEATAAVAGGAHSDLSGGSRVSVEQNLLRLLSAVNPLPSLPLVKTIPPFRRVTPGDHGVYTNHHGEGLSKSLARLKAPGLHDQRNKVKFASIERFVQSVLDAPDVRLDFPQDGSEIFVVQPPRRPGQEELVLSLDSVGMGHHQAILLAASCTLIDQELVCIEEPEIHLHPTMQRHLIRYLTTETTNQYLIATHSAHLLDHERIKIFHVQQDDSGSHIDRIDDPHQISELCADLGYRPSDLVQANAIIWVEGPSDRIYLNHWIQLAAGNDALVEGTDYAIMFYGGSVINHLTGDDPDEEDAISEFVSLRRLNRYISIMIDSDCRGPAEQPHPSKLELAKDFDDPNHRGMSWITSGYTIENYLPPDLLQTAIDQAYAKARNKRILSWTGNQWDNPLADIQGGDVEKVKVARVVCSLWKADTVSPLPDHKDRVDQIIDFIRDANKERNPSKIRATQT